MKTVTTPAIQGLSQDAILALRVEKPPVDIVVIAWHMLSKTLMPPTANRVSSRSVSPRIPPKATWQSSEFGDEVYRRSHQ